MKNVYLGLVAAVLSSTISSVAYAGPTELTVYATNAKRITDSTVRFTAELYQEGNPQPLYQTAAGKNGCTVNQSNTALTCTGRTNLDLPSKFTAVSGIGAYKVVFKSHEAGAPVQVSQDVIINHDSTSTARVLVEPFRLLTLEQRVFETAVNKRAFMLYPKSFTTAVIKSEIVKAALAETYQTLRNVRKVDEFTAFSNVVTLWKDYFAITDVELLAVLYSDVRFSSEDDMLAATQMLAEEGIDYFPLPTPGPTPEYN